MNQNNSIDLKQIKKNRRNHFINRQDRKNHLFCFLLYAWPLLLFIVSYIGVNLIGSVTLAFQNIDVTGKKTFAGFSNFVKYINLMFTDGDYLFESFKRSIWMYLLNLVFTTFFNILFAYLIFKKCRGYKILRLICFLPSAISAMVFGLAFQKFVTNAIPDIAMTYFGVEEYFDLFANPKYIFFILNFYMIWSGLVSAILVLPSSMSGISPELFDAGQVDGVRNCLQELWYIVIPNIWPTQMTYMVMGLAGIFTASGVTMMFYMYDAPIEAYNLGYYYTVLVKTAESEAFYPVLAAGGIIMTCISVPITLLGRYCMEHFGWKTE